VLQRNHLVSCILVEGGDVTEMGLDGGGTRDNYSTMIVIY
jgi:hypothetical protein